MTTRRTFTLAATALLIFAAVPAWTQDMNSVAEDRDIAFIEKCLQRAATEKVPEDRIDEFIDRCLNEFYERKEQTPDGDGGGNPDNTTRDDADGRTGKPATD